MSQPKYVLDFQTRQFYIDTLTFLKQADVPFLVGGAYALAFHAGIERHTKDLDVFLKKGDCQSALDALDKAGYQTELTFPHWLAKAYKADYFIDIIFSSGNGVAVVDDDWFDYASNGQIFGVQVKLCPPEEMIWSKAYIMERERFDGADVAHILHACSDSIDWDRLIARFENHWRVLFSHLVLFGFIYPQEKNKIPSRVMRQLMERLNDDVSSLPQDAEAAEAQSAGKTNRHQPQPLKLATVSGAGGERPSRRRTKGGANMSGSLTTLGGIARSANARRGSAGPGGAGSEKLCQGTLLSRQQYLVDVDTWGYKDARLQPTGKMSNGDILHWTMAIKWA